MSNRGRYPFRRHLVPLALMQHGGPLTRSGTLGCLHLVLEVERLATDPLEFDLEKILQTIPQLVLRTRCRLVKPVMLFAPKAGLQTK